jgi:uncharacterized coiled-coil protein SlyX
MAAVKELNKRLDDLQARHACAEKLIIGLSAELDKVPGRITSLEDLAADAVHQIGSINRSYASFLGRVQAATNAYRMS